MIARHPLVIAALIVIGSTHGAGMAGAAGPLEAKPARHADTPAPKRPILLAQRGIGSHGPIGGGAISGPLITAPPISTSPLSGSTLSSPPLSDHTLSPLTTPSLTTPSVTSPPIGGSPPPPVAQPRTRVPPYCQVTSTDSWTPSGCSSRYISFNDLWRGLRACSDNDARCFASKLLAIAKEPVVVVYPQARALELRDYLHKEIAYAVDVMGNHLKNRVNNGVGNLPSISGINDLVDRAKRQVESIDVPLNETQEEQLRRLGLTPAMISLANSVLNS